MDYIPDRFDIIYLDLDPQLGTEINKRRPCLVMSTAGFNQKSRKAFICPITSALPRSAAHIIFEGQKIKGTILVDQLRSLDWISRKAQKVDHLSDMKIYERISNIIQAIITGREWYK